jgi:hypothetical protein
MNLNEPQSWIVAVIVVLAVIAQQRFGPEYERVVSTSGDRTKAEAELRARERRVERLKIVPLVPADVVRFSEAWGGLQARFVDNPRGTVAAADKLVRDLMMKRGYPMADFERLAGDISVDHPGLVETYRAAQAVAVRDQRGEASTEDLRKAVVYYRTLFDELLDARSPEPLPAAPSSRPVMHT